MRLAWARGRLGAAACVLLAACNIVLSGLPAHCGRTGEGLVEKRQVALVIGCQSGLGDGYRSRREVLRQTWFPSSPEALKQVEEKHSTVVRFVVGFSHGEQEMEALKQESRRHGGFLRIPHMESYASLARKTHVFFKAVAREYNPQYVYKVDDDVYLVIDRLPLLLAQYSSMQWDYAGCFMANTTVLRGEEHPQWAEPQATMLGSKYITYAKGSSYLLSSRAIGWIAAMPPRSLRYFRSEDVTVGIWMATFNATHHDDLRLCQDTCTRTSVALYDVKGCSDCNPEWHLRQSYADEVCHQPPLLRSDGALEVERPGLPFVKLGEDGQPRHLHMPLPEAQA